MLSLADLFTLSVAVLCYLYRGLAPVLLAVWGAALYLGSTWERASSFKRRDAQGLHLRRAAAARRASEVYYLPSTPVEAGDFLNKFLATMWPTFVEPKIIKKMGAKIAKRIREGSPENMDVTVESLTLGSAAPHVSSFQAYSDAEGRLQHLDLSLDFDSHQLAIAIGAVVKTSTVTVKSSVTVHKIRVSGKVRVFPFKHERLLLWGFREAPAASLQLRVRGPGGVEAEVGGFSFLEKTLNSVLKKRFTLPATRAAGLEINELGRDVLGARLAVRLVGISGPPALLLRAAALEVQVQRTARQAPVLDSGGAVDRTLAFQLDGREGQVAVRALLAGGAGSGAALGGCSVQLEHMADATTAFWAQLRGGAPAAKRAATGTPWRVRLPLEEHQDVEVELEVMVREWEYGNHGAAAAEAPRRRSGSGAAVGGNPHSSSATATSLGRSHSRSHLPPASLPGGGFVQGGRSILLHVVEGRDLPAPARDRLNPLVRVRYGTEELSTRAAGRTVAPFWDEVLMIEENMFSKKLALEVCDTRGGAQRVVGAAALRLEALQEGAPPAELQLQLEGADTGELVVRVAVVAGAPGDAAVERAAARMRRHCSVLEVEVARGRGLAKRDRFGTSDPYVVVEHGASRTRTRTIKANVNPEWRQRVKMPFRAGEGLLLEVFDWDRASDDDFMGRARIPAERLAALQAGEEATLALQLADVECGTLEITLTRTDALPPGEPLDDLDDDDDLDGEMPGPESSSRRGPASASISSRSLADMASGIASRVLGPFDRILASSSVGASSADGQLQQQPEGEGEDNDSGGNKNKKKGEEEKKEEEDGAMAREIQELRAALAEKAAAVSAMEEQHGATIRKMKRDQDTLLSKVQELEDALATL